MYEVLPRIGSKWRIALYVLEIYEHVYICVCIYIKPEKPKFVTQFHRNLFSRHSCWINEARYHIRDHRWIPSPHCIADSILCFFMEGLFILGVFTASILLGSLNLEKHCHQNSDITQGATSTENKFGHSIILAGIATGFWPDYRVSFSAVELTKREFHTRIRQDVSSYGDRLCHHVNKLIARSIKYLIYRSFMAGDIFIYYTYIICTHDMHTSDSHQTLNIHPHKP